MMSRKKIMVVEDNRMNRMMLCGILTSASIYEVLEAQDGQAALNILKQYGEEISLILLDINMPVMDGYEALRGVREISPDVPVIALTAYAFETDRQRMFQAGFNECLAKPLRADELRTRIAALLSR